MNRLQDLEPEVWGSRVAGYVFAAIFMLIIYGGGLLLALAAIKGVWLILTA